MTLKDIRNKADQALRAINTHDYNTASSLMLEIRTELDSAAIDHREIKP